MTGDIVDMRALRDQASEAPPLEDDGLDQVDDRGGDDREHTGKASLDPKCPIVPLGVRGKVCYYLDALGQLQDLPWKEHSHNNIKGMFGSYNYLLEEIWPRKKPIFDEDKSRIIDWEITGWKPEEAAADLIAAASDLGVWNPFDKVRGVGAWLGRNGELILHCGDAIYVSPPQGDTNKRGKWHKPGVIDGFVYPAGAPTHRPSTKPVPASGKKIRSKEGEERFANPGDAVLHDYETWSLDRGDLDAKLLLGVAASQMIGGALKVRPGSWITGRLGSGKSALVDAVKYMHGENGLVKLDNATPAAIWQRLKYDSRPVLLDENGDQGDYADPRQAQAMLHLIRLAVTGGELGRGSSGHDAVGFVARSSFMCGSILMPPMDPQDRSRIIVFELDRLKTGGRVPDLSPRRWNAIGAAMLTRLVHQWHRFDKTFAVYRQALLDMGHIGRSADVFGTALTCADMVLYDRTPAADDEFVLGLAKRLDAAQLAETSGGTSDEIECWQHLLSSLVDPYRQGGRHAVREWIERACGRGRGDEKLLPAQVDEANHLLQTFGMRICRTKELAKLFKPEKGINGPWPHGLDPDQPYLAVANKHPGLQSIFREKRWASGVWAQSLGRLDGAFKPPQPIWLSGDDNAIKGGSVRVTLVPLFEAGSGQGDGTSPERAAAASGGSAGGAPSAAAVDAAFDFTRGMTEGDPDDGDVPF